MRVSIFSSVIETGAGQILLVSQPDKYSRVSALQIQTAHSQIKCFMFVHVSFLKLYAFNQ